MAVGSPEPLMDNYATKQSRRDTQFAADAAPDGSPIISTSDLELCNNIAHTHLHACHERHLQVHSAPLTQRK